MRRTETESGVFRASLHELTTMVVYEAARLFAVVFTDRVPSAAARASTPTLSTPGSPCRRARSVPVDVAVAVMKGILRGALTFDLD